MTFLFFLKTVNKFVSLIIEYRILNINQADKEKPINETKGKFENKIKQINIIEEIIIGIIKIFNTLDK